ncbi:MAG: S8 family serine peptidase [Desulfosarcina sp.]|nr:S8 family serine peptidase [Desulfosarcina sp.]
MKLLKPVTFILMICLAPPPSITMASDSVVLIQDDRLTLDVKNQALSTILAISSVLKSVDYALIWRKDKASTTSEPRLWEIRIFYKGQESRIRPLQQSANLNVVKKGVDAYHVKDILLIRLAPDMTEAALAALLDRLGATIIDAYTPLGIVRLRLPHGSDVPAIAETITNTPGIQDAEPDYAHPLKGGSPVRLDPSSPPPPPSRSPSTGTTPVAVMDSGLLSDYTSSPYVQAAYDAVSPGAEVSDGLGHGTQMALIAAGAVNPLGAGPDTPAGSPVVAIRAFDDNGFTSNYTLIRGIDFAVEKGVRVLSLSWGSETPSPLLESAIRYAAAKGLILVAAAGNAPTGNPVYPAAYDSVIGVGALAPNGDPWDQSNFGDFVSVTAPGVADLPVGYQGDPGTYAGTSIATAYTARRVAAILNQNPDADRETILRILVEGN